MSNFPLVDRATQGLYAPGLHVQARHALAMAKYGIFGINDYYNDTGSVTVERQTFSNAKHEQFGPVDLQQAITVSSDAYFYTVGNDFWKVWKAGDTTRGLGIQTRGPRARLRRADRHRARRAERPRSRPRVEVGLRTRELQVEGGAAAEQPRGIPATT